MKKVKTKLVEVSRSFTFKVNLGGYQTADFYCGQRAEVPEKEATKKSEQLYAFCKEEVMKSIASFLKEREPKETKSKAKETFDIPTL